MSAAYDLDVGSLTTLTCGVAGCGIAFAIPSPMETARRRDGKDFYCPNGHVIAFGNSENERLKRDLANKQKQLEWAEQRTIRAKEEAAHNEARRRSTKAALTKTRAKIAKGCCPVCSAAIPDLAVHMQEKHAERAPAEGAPK